MSRNPVFVACATAILHVCVAGSAAAEDGKTDAAGAFQVPEKIEFLLEDHCWKCHEGGRQKGDIRLDDLAGMENSKLLDLLNRVQEQVYFKHMPPKTEEPITPFSPPSGPATGSFNGLHPKSKFLATNQLARKTITRRPCRQENPPCASFPTQ